MRSPAIRLLAPCAAILLALAGVSCGDSGPEEAPDFSGSYRGEFYVIAISGDPGDAMESDSLSFYPVTLRLAERGEEIYDFGVL
jgi:hypothetical protein